MSFPENFLWGGELKRKEDLPYMTKMGLKCVRILVPWSSLKEDIEYYEDLVNACLACHIEPMISLDYRDHQWKYEMIDQYVDDLMYLFEKLNHKVRYWLTIDRPNDDLYHRFFSEGSGDLKSFYQYSHYLILAHAKAVVRMKKMNPGVLLGGGMTYIPAYALSNRPTDALAKVYFDNLVNDFYLDAYVYGRYPRMVLSFLKSKNMLMNISDEERNILKKAAGLIDFISIYYFQSTTVAFNSLSGHTRFGKHYIKEIPGLYRYRHNPYVSTIYDPNGLSFACREITSRYDIPIMILRYDVHGQEKIENNRIHDAYRIDYLREHLKEVKKAIEDGSKIIGCCMTPVVSDDMSQGLVYKDIEKDSYRWCMRMVNRNGADLS